MNHRDSQFPTVNLTADTSWAGLIVNGRVFPTPMSLSDRGNRSKSPLLLTRLLRDDRFSNDGSHEEAILRAIPGRQCPATSATTACTGARNYGIIFLGQQPCKSFRAIPRGGRSRSRPFTAKEIVGIAISLTVARAVNPSSTHSQTRSIHYFRLHLLQPDKRSSVHPDCIHFNSRMIDCRWLFRKIVFNLTYKNRIDF